MHVALQLLCQYAILFCESLCSLCAHLQQLNMHSKQLSATEVPSPADPQSWLVLPA